MHVSLDSALGRQRRLNSVGESVLQIAPSAAAAYSLRSLTGGDPRSVRVRRSALSGSENEIDFTVSEVSSGALTSFVTEPVSTLINSAYYFSPDSHSHVDFDSDITLADGETMSLKYFFEGVTGTDMLFDSGGASANSMLITTSIAPRVRINSESVDFGVGCKLLINQLDTLTIARSGNDITITTGTGAVTKSFTSGAFKFNRLGGNASQTFQGVLYNLQIGSRHNYTGLGGAATAWNDTVGSNNGTPDNLVSFTGQTVDGFVETWYDQSGNSNDAVQATAGSQPKIVSAGALNTSGGLEFDGSDDFFSLTSNISFENKAGCVFSAQDGQDSSNDFTLGFSGSNRGVGFRNIQTRWFYTSNAIDIDNSSGTSGLTLFTALHDGTTNDPNVTAFVNSSLIVDGSPDPNQGEANVSTVANQIGARRALSFLEGTVKEIVIYDTDQTNNRAALETEIISHYGIS